MDVDGVELLDALVESRIGALRDSLSTDSPPRGGSLFPLMGRIIDAVDQERADIVDRLRTADSESRQALGRKLLRCAQKLDVVHLNLADYGSDAGRQDVPVGLLCLIDTLVEDLLPASADVLVHLDSQRMYSTLSLTRTAADLLNDKSAAGTPSLLVFNLPAIDHANALYAPILAHEVGHSLVRDGDLVGELIADHADLNALDALLTRCLEADPGIDPGELKGLLVAWLTELLCDAVAVVLCGPSFLFAAGAFLPAPAPGFVGTHPFPADRIALVMGQLEGLGWKPYLGTQNPALGAWLADLQTKVPPAGGPQETFLRGAVTALADAVAAVARNHVPNVLAPEPYAAIAPELREFLEAGIPPSRLKDGVPSPWQLILGGWEVALEHHGDSPRSLGLAVSDRKFNDFLVKSLEIVRVTQLWDEVQ